MANDARQIQSGGGVSPEEDFISLREILVMILRHRWAIAIFVLLVTLAAGIYYITRPRTYQAEGYLQVIPPVTPDLKVDKELFETRIVSHLQRVSSAFIAKNVASALKSDGIEITPLDLSGRIKITRPPKTDLIRLVAGGSAPERAITILRQWIRVYQEGIIKNNIRTTLSQIHLLLKQAQADVMEKQAAVEKLKSQAAQTEALVTVSRGVDDRQLWSDLARPTAADADALKRLSEIHIKGQEQSTEYINLRITLNNAEQALASVQARRNFYQEVERMLEARANANGDDKGKAGEGESKDSDAALYVNTILKSSEIVQFGEPGLISDSRGALKKTAMVFAVALFFSCFCAFVGEWGKGLFSSR